jgi:uncharacterized protein
MSFYRRLSIAALTLTLATGPAFAQRDEVVTLRTSEIKVDPAKPVIDLNVTASVLSAPDTATFTTGVETKALKARDAIAKNAEKMKVVVAQLKALGIADKDIQTSALSLQREVDYLPGGKTRFKGYRVGNVVTAKLRDLDRLGDALDALASSGATEFSGPEFTLENQDGAKSQARDKAWANATQIARYHAGKAGFRDVRVVRISETIRQRGENKYDYAYAAEAAVDAAADAAAVETPMQPGELNIDVALSISFEMVP